MGLSGLRGLSGLSGIAGGVQSLSPETIAITNAITTPLIGSDYTAIENLVASLKSQGIWDAINTLHCYCYEPYFDWKRPTTGPIGTIIGPGVTFAARSGTTTSSSSIINTNFVPATHGVGISASSIAIAFDSRTNNNQGGNRVEIDSVNFAAGRNAFVSNYLGTAYLILNSITLTASALGTVLGFHQISRASGVTSYHKDGALQVSGSGTGTATLSEQAITIGGQSSNGVNVTLPSPQRYTCFMVAQYSVGLVASLYSSIDAFLTEIGAKT